VPSAPALPHVQPFRRQLVEPASRQPLRVLGNLSDFLRSLHLAGFLLESGQKSGEAGCLAAGGRFRSGFWLVLPAVQQLWCGPESMPSTHGCLAGLQSLVQVWFLSGWSPWDLFPSLPKSWKKALRIPHLSLSSWFFYYFWNIAHPSHKRQRRSWIPNLGSLSATKTTAAVFSALCLGRGFSCRLNTGFLRSCS